MDHNGDLPLAMSWTFRRDFAMNCFEVKLVEIRRLFGV